MSLFSYALTAEEINHLYSISRTINQAEDWKQCMEQVVPLLRSLMIFDSIVVYLYDPQAAQLDVGYARSIGRGRANGTDIAWGESAASQVLQSRQPLHLEPALEGDSRLDQPYITALPILHHSNLLGVLIFIRFGEHTCTPSDMAYSSIFAEELAHLLNRKTLEEAVARLEAEQQQARLQEDFISTISHELLTPLGFIKGYATTLLRSDATWDDKTRREFLTIIDEETDRLQELIDNMLDSARLQSGTMKMDFQPVRLDALLRDTVMRARTHHKNLQVLLNIETTLQPIHGDPRRLSQVFDNIIGNAIKYAPQSPIIISLTRKNHDLLISFQDHGPGIPAQYVPHLFERFYRNPEQAMKVRGTGLGLYICRQLVEAHHGDIWVESYSGEGTTFYIQLPASIEHIEKNLPLANPRRRYEPNSGG
ncbi:MAG TPA: ATP-binding protein [Anaerolineaceae bacterium]|nr:ATP-binding protein [Anaerolineaceae bacterium]HPN53929.1 ATP-binding protein [Anaerolineaceae bacterium]